MTRLLWVLVLCIAAPVYAVDAGKAFEDPVMQARYVAITSEVRCVKCQNEAIRDSNSRIATDLRREVRRLLSEGMSDAEIYDYLVARYGEFVLYRPPAKGKTLFIWLAPGFFLLIGGIVVFRIMKRRFAMPLDEKGA
ncbi:MAG: cytochrome c-type biogenesis protein [Pseudomonadota bacterium]